MHLNQRCTDIMKKAAFIISFTALFFNCFSQTKADTEEWIKTQIEDYRYNGNYGFKNYEIIFEDGDLMEVAPIGEEIFYEKISLKSINQATVTAFKAEGEDREGYVIKLRCKSHGSCIETGKVENGNYVPSIESKEAPSTETIEEIFIYLDISFQNDNLPERMKRALKHLIELNGGRLINDVF